MLSVKGFVAGRVQGVGFRYFVLRQAESAGLSGYVRNLQDGRVEFLLQGDAAAVEIVLAQIRIGPSYSRVSEVALEDETEPFAGTEFMIR